MIFTIEKELENRFLEACRSQHLNPDKALEYAVSQLTEQLELKEVHEILRIVAPHLL